MTYLRQTNNFAKKNYSSWNSRCIPMRDKNNVSRIIAIFVLNSWCGIKCQADVAICQMYDFRSCKSLLIHQDSKYELPKLYNERKLHLYFKNSTVVMLSAVTFFEKILYSINPELLKSSSCICFHLQRYNRGWHFMDNYHEDFFSIKKNSICENIPYV